MSQQQRLFFALVPGRQVIDRISALQSSLAGDGRAVKSHQFHVTLAFLGMQKPELVPDILDIASRLSFEPCRVVLDRLGRFKRAGVLWLGTSELPGSLEGFQHALVNALLDAGIGHDRKAWKFHLTLYRKMRKPTPILDPIMIEWPLESFSLIESVGVKNGVEYRSVGRWKARNSDAGCRKNTRSPNRG